MSFIKKNYEKVVLGVVLLGLFGALLYLPIAIKADKDNLQSIVDGITHAPPKPLPDLNMALEDGALGRVQSSYNLDLETTNRLFNPMQWQKASDGRWIENRTGNELGPGAVQVTKIVPLYYILRLDSIEPANQFGPARYVISIEQQDAPIAVQRRPRKHYLSAGEKDAQLALISATGPAANPQLLVQIISTGEQVTITKTKSFQEVTGYAADFRYPPENRQWYDQRVGAVINLNRNDYKVVVIDQNELVLSAESNQKKTTRPYQP